MISPTEPSDNTSEPVIEIRNLVKKYAGTTAVNEVSFAVNCGEIVGFLGPNGAGKSTTMRILTGFIPATSGTATVCGHSVSGEADKIRPKLGYMPENNPLPEDLRVGEYLRLRGKLKGLRGKNLRDQIDLVLEKCDLTRSRRRIIGTLSKGFRQRVGIAEAIIADPEIIIMDEPTIGLDPHQIAMIRDLITSLKRRMTILISSHILPEIEMTCDRVIIINAGRIVASDTPRNLRREFVPGARYEAEWSGDEDLLLGHLQNLDPEFKISRAEEELASEETDFRTIHLHSKEDKEFGEDLIQALTKEPSFRLRSLHRKDPTLEEVFMAATKRSWEVVMPEAPVTPETQNGD
ncbi:MAG: ABC transporter ATP-binding protein [Opitutales bacterium]|nr:ABC transporter ATP-binding protein [Opitutales bacterium]MCH8540746.1 ABC transporter ATP-binding protein [Opitutales bacterium]